MRSGFFHKRSLAAVCLMALVCAPGAFAQDVRARVDLSRTQVALGDAVVLDVAIEGAQDAAVPDVQVPGAAVQYIGPSTMVSIVNGRMSSSVTHRFSLMPQKTGTLTIGPITVAAGGGTVKTEPVTLEVLSAASRPAQPVAPPASEPEAVSIGDALQLKIGVDKRRLYAGEAIPARIQLLVGGIAVRGIEMPELAAEGFLVKPLGQPKQSDVSVGGQRLTLLEFDTVIVPMRAGELSLGPAKLTCQVLARSRPSRAGRRRPSGQDPFDDFFGDSFFDDFFTHTQVQPVTVTADPVTIDVLPLPESGKPASFAGAVGGFSLDVAAVPSQVAVGEPVTVTLTVRGEGNLDTVTAPVIPLDDMLFKKYTPQVKSAGTDAEGRTKVFEQVLIPLSTDANEIPGVVFSCFDPETGAYRTTRTDPIAIEVTPAATAAAPRVIDSTMNAAPVARTAAPDPVGRDIVYIKERLGALMPVQRRWHNGRRAFALYALPLLLLIANGFGRRLWRMRRSGPSARAGRALSRALAHCRAADKLRQEGKAREAYAEIFRALQRYLGDRWNLSAESLTRTELESVLRKQGAPDEMIGALSALCERCDASRFGNPLAAAENLGATLSQAEALLKRLDAGRLR